MRISIPTLLRFVSAAAFWAIIYSAIASLIRDEYRNWRRFAKLLGKVFLVLFLVYLFLGWRLLFWPLSWDHDWLNNQNEKDLTDAGVRSTRIPIRVDEANPPVTMGQGHGNPIHDSFIEAKLASGSINSNGVLVLELIADETPAFPRVLTSVRTSPLPMVRAVSFYFYRKEVFPFVGKGLPISPTGSVMFEISESEMNEIIDDLPPECRVISDRTVHVFINGEEVGSWTFPPVNSSTNGVEYGALLKRTPVDGKDFVSDFFVKPADGKNLPAAIDSAVITLIPKNEPSSDEIESR